MSQTGLESSKEWELTRFKLGLHRVGRVFAHNHERSELDRGNPLGYADGGIRDLGRRPPNSMNLKMLANYRNLSSRIDAAKPKTRKEKACDR